MLTWFQCKHKRTSLPITRPVTDTDEGNSKRQKNIYVVCLSCGRTIPYSFHEGRVVGERRNRAPQGVPVSDAGRTA